MVFELSTNSIDRISADAIVIFAFQDKKKFVLTSEGERLNNDLNNLIVKTLEFEQFKGGVAELVEIHLQEGALAKKISILGLGKKEEFTRNGLRRVIALYTKRAHNKLSSLVIEKLTGRDSSLSVFDLAFVLSEGILLASYEFVKYKKDEKNKQLESVIFVVEAKDKPSVQAAIKKAELYVKATNLARDLVNEPADVATPTYIARIAADIAKSDSQIKLTIFDKPQIEKMGMNAFLGIARAAGDKTPPKFVCLEYKPKILKNKKKLAIVGKGITFDTGGINVKPGDHMNGMKMDMAGAAAMLGVFSVIAKIQPDFEVIGLTALTPNLVSATSIVPGDVVKALNGKTIEVLNSDAEGRVTMADTLSYAVKQNATEIIELSTLTGACLVALGTDIAGLMSNNKDLAEKVKTSAYEAGEDVWELPLPKEMKKLNKSEVADIANIPSTRWGGTITAGLFLEEFVDNKPFVHIDIAGPAFIEGSSDFGPKGGSGFGVRLLLNYISEGITK